MATYENMYARVNSKAVLQVCHLTLLFTVPVLYTILKLNSESHDYVPRMSGNALVVAGAMWSSYIIVMTIRHGNKDNVVKNIIEVYRKQLNGYSFLIITNIALSLILSFLLYQLLFYRQVEFISTSDIQLILSKDNGGSETLGVIKGNQPTKFRLKVGKRYLAYAKLTTENVIAINPIEVSQWWSGKEVPSVKIIVEEQTYEPTELQFEEPIEETAPDSTK